MKVQFQNAKNGELTATYNNLFLHSNYNPKREAERFVESIEIQYCPTLIIITEPCLSYIVPLLKNKFQNAKIAVIRYLPDFSEYNNSIDYVFNFFELKGNISEEMLTVLGEETIINSLFLQWQPSSKAFEEIENKVLPAIKDLYEKSKTLLVTREYFEKKWFLNSINYVSNIHNVIRFNKIINIPVIIISSGPSLKSSIEIIKKNKDKLFIISLSSAIKVCISNNIIPDLCISTDGGFWAGEHLKSLKKYNIPLGAPLEAYIPKKILQKNLILPMKYNDGLSSKITDFCNFDFDFCERNGTVSGTALLYALAHSSGDIFYCGLDMANQRGFQHCQPNELELNNCLGDCKIRSCEQRNAKSEYSAGVLSVYKEWFGNLELGGRNVYRVIEPEYKKNNLGKIKDISKEDFYLKTSKLNNKKEKDYFNKSDFSIDKTNLLNYINDIWEESNTEKSLFPLSYSSLKRNKNNTDIINRLNKEKLRLLNKIKLILNDK